MSSLSDLLLRTVVNVDYQTKGATLTFEEVDNNFILLAEVIKESIQAADPGGIEAFNPVTVYSSGEYVTSGSNLWEFVNPTPTAGVLPGSDDTFWALRSTGVLAHAQNTDTHSTSNEFGVGDGTDTDKDIFARNGDTNTPRLRYNSSTNKWQYSNDGTTFIDFVPGWSTAGTTNLTAAVDIVSSGGEHVNFSGAAEFNLNRSGNRDVLLLLDPEAGGLGDGGLNILINDPGTDDGLRLSMDDLIFRLSTTRVDNDLQIYFEDVPEDDTVTKILALDGSDRVKYIDIADLGGGVWPASGLGTLTGLVQMVDDTSDAAGVVIQGISTTSMHFASMGMQMTEDGVNNFGSVGFSVGNGDYSADMQFNVYDSSGPLAEWQIQDNLVSGASFIRIDSTMKVQMIPSAFNGTWAELNSGYPGSGNEDKHYIRLYGVDDTGGQGIRINSDDDASIVIGRDTDLFGITYRFEEQYFKTGSNAGYFVTGINSFDDITTTMAMDISEIRLTTTNDDNSSYTQIRLKVDDLVFRKATGGDFVFENAGISADAALVSTHSMIISNGSTQYKVMLVQI